MVYKIMSIDELTKELIGKYFPILTEAKQKKIVSLESVKDRALVFCSEIISRQALSEFCNAPEFSFQLLINPNSKSVVGNFDVEICVVCSDNIVACAVSDKPIGISLVPVKPFTFKDAQNKFSDSEIRAVFSDSVYTFSEIINFSSCEEKNVIQKYALLASLKEAHFYSTGRGIRAQIKNTTFEINNDTLICSDSECRIIKSYIDNNKSIAISVIERSKKNE